MPKTSNPLFLGEKILQTMSDLSRDELFRRIANVYSDDESHANRLFYYFSKKYFCPSTPVVANIHEDGKPFKGLPISCFLNEADKEFVEETIRESSFFSKIGGGIGTLWSDVGGAGSNYGVLPFIQCQGKLTRLVSGQARKTGSMCAYLDIDHCDILQFIAMRKTTQGIDAEFAIPRYIHHAVIISDAFMNAVIRKENWELKSQDGPGVVKPAREIWMDILNTRCQTGAPYIFFKDNAAKQLAPHHRKLGLNIKMSNLCTEITLPTGKDFNGRNRTAVCCLSSINLFKYDQWKQEEHFLEDITRFIDNVLTYFIHEAPKRNVGDVFSYDKTFGITHDMRPKEKESVEDALKRNHPSAQAIYSAHMSRDVGIGICGWSTLLQSKGISFESKEATRLNKEISIFIKTGIDNASKKLAHERGSCPDINKYNEDFPLDEKITDRMSYKTAIAPTSQISSILGVSKCIEVDDPVYLNKNHTGFLLMKNPFLREYLESQGQDHYDIWHKIAEEGLASVVPRDIYDIFKGPYEIDHLAKISQAADRQKLLVDQAQSFSIFLNSPINKHSLINIHMQAWKQGLKTMYYLRSTPKINASASLKVKEQDECVMCQ